MNTALRPMLAAKAPEDLDRLRYPLLASPKLDGLRCLVIDGVAVSRSLKRIRNRHIQALLGDPRFNGLDGELIVGSPTAPDCYRRTDSAVMSSDGEPDFRFYVFDDWSSHEPFATRRLIVSQRCDNELLIAHEHTAIHDSNYLEAYEASLLSQGYEGLILRDMNAPYKFGRSTEKQGFMLKLKRFTDGEAIVVGVEELQRNYNDATIDERGYTKRSSHQENKCGAGVLGALVCQPINTINPELRFSIGTGFDAITRETLWNARHILPGRIVKYKSFSVGVKDKPRHPVFLGFRDRSDM